MHVISSDRLGTEFNPDMASIAGALPDVDYLTLEFKECSAADASHCSEVVMVKIYFLNKSILAVPGYMLSKYTDMIPNSLGNEYQGYFDTNSFSHDHPERLMRRIRIAFKAMFVEPPKKTVPSPIAATISIRLYDFIANYPVET